MAAPVATQYPSPVSSPPPVYLRTSPPPRHTLRDATPRSIPKRAPRAPPPPSVPPVMVNGANLPASSDIPHPYDVPAIPTTAFARLSVVEQKDSHQSTHNSPKTSRSSSDHDLPSGHNSPSQGSLDSLPQVTENYEPLHYHHQPYRHSTGAPPHAPSANRSAENVYLSAKSPRRPHSVYSFASENASPHGSPYLHPSSRSSTASPDARPLSFVDLLNTSYPQPGPAPASLDNTHLRASVGNNASLLSHKQTFDMYLSNVKKTDDPAIQYEFAVFMVNAMLEMPPDQLDDPKSAIYGSKGPEITRAGLLKEARSILQRLSDRSYPFAQYYLADGYASGLFNKGQEDYDHAFPLFVAASKRGHVEACYRAALCYEFGWGTRVEAARAQQFYRQAASKNHPGAMLRMAKACLAGDMGLGKRYREGVKWMKRATESSDAQYNSAPYELGLLHESGFGDDVFPDPAYAAQLFTKSADLGHVEASYRLGDAYEHGKLDCPRDPALSIHFYTGAAQGGHALSMMALCAWYLVGAEPVLEKDECEAYEWAKRAAETGLVKAQYAVGYFSEMGIGCRRDPLEAKVWYMKAADQGDSRAMHRIAAIQAAAEGMDPAQAAEALHGKKGDKKENGKPKRFGIF